ncbi:hypothetical protein Hanom_Chr03g00205291 [Helianthus anomalus]
MATKTKPQGPRFKKFEIWTKMAKVPKPQGPKWQFTLLLINTILCIIMSVLNPNPPLFKPENFTQDSV